MRNILGLLFLMACSTDVDNDGFVAENDCDDDNPSINPDATELCDGIDNNCDGQVDEGVTQVYYLDNDGDGFGDSAASEENERIATSCVAPEGFVDNQSDCDDTNAGINPSATEVCDDDDIDENCNGLADDNDTDPIGVTAWYLDNDSDGFADSTSTLDACDQPLGYIAAQAGDRFDCDDSDPSVRPETASEMDEGINLEVVGDSEDIDENCDGFIACYFDGDDDGYGAGTPILQPVGTNCDGLSELVGNLSRTDDDCDDDNALTYPAAAYAEPGGDCMQDNDLDGYGDSAPPEGVSPGQDCDDDEVNISPAASEIEADGIDQDCDGGDVCYFDADNDGYGNTSGNPINSSDLLCDGDNEADNLLDCDDTDASTYPGAAIYEAEIEVATGFPSCKKDSDGDGYGDISPSVTVIAGSDCDDTDAAQYPNADEYCNGEDDDCDSFVDESGSVDELDYFIDSDADGYVDSSVVAHQCYAPDGYLSADEAFGMSDCNDSDALVNPGVSEGVADGVDENCDGYEACYVDADSDGFGSDSVTYVVDVEGTSDCSTDLTSVNSDDCDDFDTLTYPGAALNDSSTFCMTDSDGDGYGDDYADSSLSSLPVDLITGSDCNDSDNGIRPGVSEVSADGIDQNCDGIEECWLDADEDGQGNALGNIISVNHDGQSTFSCDGVSSASNQTDCDDTNPDIFEGADEYCNDEDDDCDGQIDEGINDNAPIDAPTWYADADNDGYGGLEDNLVLMQCDQPNQYTSIDDAIDCNDLNADANPFANETCFDGVDNDCDGFIDGMNGCEKTAGSDAFVQVLGANEDDRAGYDIATGDVDGDGYDDLVLAAPGEGNGRIYVLYGPLRDVNLGVDYDATFIGDANDVSATSGLGLGLQVELIDLNGDDQKDIVASASGSNDLGVIYIRYSPENARYSGDYTMSTEADATVSGNETSTTVGCLLSSAGDLNDDRLEDLLIGTCTDRTDTSGFAVALYGQETNLLSGDYTISNSTGLTEGNGAVGIDYTGVFEGSGSIDTAALQDQFGSYLGGFGDLDGDGFDDIGFGAPGALSTDQGVAYLLYGDSNPYDSEYVSTVDMDASITGINTGDKLGMAFAGGGDINGDGYNELLVSAPEASTAQGYVQIFTGQGENSGVSGALTDAVATIYGETNNDYFGSDILGIQDINGDGYSDVLISARRNSNIGGAYLFYGPLEGSINLSSGDEAAGKLTGQTVSAGLNTDFGTQMTLADMNGDGALDIVISSGSHDTTDSTNVGAAFIFTSLLE